MTSERLSLKKKTVLGFIHEKISFLSQIYVYNVLYSSKEGYTIFFKTWRATEDIYVTALPKLAKEGVKDPKFVIHHVHQHDGWRLSLRLWVSMVTGSATFSAPVRAVQKCGASREYRLALASWILMVSFIAGTFTNSSPHVYHAAQEDLFTHFLAYVAHTLQYSTRLSELLL